MTLPRILIVIRHESSDKALDGSLSPGAVVGVRANLPARYLDIWVAESEITERDANGAVTQLRWPDEDHPRGDTPFEVPFEPPLYEDGIKRPVQPSEPPNEEWLVSFWDRKELTTALVVKAPDVIAAAHRVKEEFPQARIHSIEEVWSEEDHPMAYLDEHLVILPVGGPRLPRTPDTKQ